MATSVRASITASCEGLMEAESYFLLFVVYCLFICCNNNDIAQMSHLKQGGFFAF